jgi:hypothetical protein
MAVPSWVTNGEGNRAMTGGPSIPSKLSEWKAVATARKAASKTTYSDAGNANEIQNAIMAYVLTH